MATNFFIRRRQSSAGPNPGRLEYLFLAAESLDISGEDVIISPSVPGNDSSTIKGPSSPNFILNIGTERVTIRVGGYILPMTADKYPSASLTGTRFYLYDAGASQTATDQTAESIRNVLLNFWADQSSVNYDEWILGWPNWGASDDSTAASLGIGSGYTVRLWEGMMRGPRMVENAGEPSQFPYSFSWIVGDT